MGKGAGLRSECSRIADLSSSGEHKPAVDAAREAEMAGVECSPEILKAVERSRSRLQKADSYVHKAVKRRKEGNLLSARANLDLALEVYPKYYWVQTLKKNVDSSIQAELDSLVSEASYFESRGDPDGALSRIQDAVKLSPGDEGLRSEAARLEQVVVETLAQQRVLDTLDKARSHLDAGRYEEARSVLKQGNPPLQLGPRGQELLAEITRRRQEHAGRRLELAVKTEKAGDLDEAAGRTLDVLSLSMHGDPQAERIVNFARLLGMKLYSAGQLSRAKELWSGALGLDPDNQKLKNYIKEVDARLDSLDRIKKGGASGNGN